MEEQFYLVWPWVILFVREKHLKYVFALSIAGGIALTYVLSVVMQRANQPVLVFNCIGCFALGGWYAHARHQGSEQQFRKRFLPFFIVAIAIYFRWRYHYDQFWGYTNFLFRMIDGTIALQIIILAVNNTWKPARKYLWENRVLTYLGKISYGIYLYHYVLQPIYDGYTGRMFARHPDLPAFLRNYSVSWGIKFALLIVICTLSYYLVELPLLRLKDRFKYVTAPQKR